MWSLGFGIGYGEGEKSEKGNRVPLISHLEEKLELDRLGKHLRHTTGHAATMPQPDNEAFEKRAEAS